MCKDVDEEKEGIISTPESLSPEGEGAQEKRPGEEKRSTRDDQGYVREERGERSQTGASKFEQR